MLEPLRPQLPDDLSDSLTLDAIADLLRITRNDAGHPTSKTVDEDTAYTHLQMAGEIPPEDGAAAGVLRDASSDSTNAVATS